MGNEKCYRRNQRLKTIHCTVNYTKPSRNLTSISYTIDGTVYSVFIDGLYSGEIDIEYTGKVFNKDNIVRIK